MTLPARSVPPLNVAVSCAGGAGPRWREGDRAGGVVVGAVPATAPLGPVSAIVGSRLQPLAHAAFTLLDVATLVAPDAGVVEVTVGCAPPPR